MKKGALALSFVFFFSLVVYVLLPNPSFPLAPSDAVQSNEPGDSEDLGHLRAYFTNFTREEVMNFYKSQMNTSSFFSLSLPTYRLNYPPEEAGTIIHDQARSTFLEEVVHPLRESVFVNGFEPKVAKDEIWYKGTHYRQKITIRFVPSNVIVRVLIVILSVGGIILVVKEWNKTLKWIFR